MSAASDWLAAISTPVALFTVGYQIRQQRREAREREEERQQERASQARLIHPVIVELGPITDRHVSTVKTSVANDGQQPIHNLQLNLADEPLREARRLGTLRPQATTEPVEWELLRPTLASRVGPELFEIVFTDQFSRLWYRKGTFQPEEIRLPWGRLVAADRVGADAAGLA